MPRAIALCVVSFAAYLIAQNPTASQDRSGSSSRQAPSAQTAADSSDKPAIQHGELLHIVRPNYPKEARRRRITGEVALKAVVAKSGTVKDITVVSGDPLLVEAAKDAASKWTFKPYLQNGEPFDVPIRIRMTFGLTPDGHPEFSSDYADDMVEPPRGGAGAEGGNDSGERVYNIREGGITPPHLTYGPDPEYTDFARKKKIQGTVLLDCVITREGTTRDLAVVNSLDPGLDQQAMEAVRGWKFDPALKDGQPVAVKVRVEVTFRLYRSR